MICSAKFVTKWINTFIWSAVSSLIIWNVSSMCVVVFFSVFHLQPRILHWILNNMPFSDEISECIWEKKYFAFWIRYHSVLGNDDVIKWKHFSRHWPFVRGIHRSPVNLCMNQQLSKQWKRRWFETPSRPLRRHSKGPSWQQVIICLGMTHRHYNTCVITQVTWLLPQNLSHVSHYKTWYMFSSEFHISPVSDYAHTPPPPPD